MLKLKFLKTFRKKEPKIYQKCNELPIHNFNEIANNNDFDYLKINKSDKVCDLILQSTWLNIIDEFYKLSKNTGALNKFQTELDLMLLQKKKDVFESISYAMNNSVNVDEFCKSLKIKKENINQHIGIVNSRINLAKDNLPKNNDSDISFDDTIAIIIKNGFQINRHTTVVSEWCSILNLIKKQQNGK